jgi:hypothetical protein
MDKADRIAFSARNESGTPRTKDVRSRSRGCRNWDASMPLRSILDLGTTDSDAAVDKANADAMEEKRMKIIIFRIQ